MGMHAASEELEKVKGSNSKVVWMELEGPRGLPTKIEYYFS